MSVAAVKIAQKKAGISDQEYRSLLQRVAGVRSSKELDDASTRRVLAELYRIRDRNAEGDGERTKQPRPQAERSPAERKLWALWYDLMRYLPEPERRPQYLLGIVRRASGVYQLPSLYYLAELTPYQMHQTIEALKQRVTQEETALAEATNTSNDVPF